MSAITKEKFDWQNHIIASVIDDGHSTRSSYGFFVLEDYYVGLPSCGLKGKWVELRTSNGIRVIAPVGSIGPWNGAGKKGQYDDRYWDNNKRPQAEFGTSKRAEKTNKAGIEISISLWQKMGFEDSQQTEVVNWRFANPTKDGNVHLFFKDGTQQRLHNSGG